MLSRVALNKKERNLTIAAGVTIGVVLSWGLFTRWQADREAFQSNLPGNYDSNVTIHGKPLLCAPPKEIQERYPGGRVVHHVAEANASATLPGIPPPEHIWTISTKSGSYKFVRVEQAVSADANATGELSLYRGAEVFVWLHLGTSEANLRDTLPEERYNLLGENERRGCYLVQFREVSPAGLPGALRELAKNPGIAKVEPCPIAGALP